MYLVENLEHAFCPMCGNKNISKQPEISEIEETPEGFLLKGVARCMDCGKLLQWGRAVPVELSDLKCPSCKQANLFLAFKNIMKDKRGYTFSALLKCKTQKCVWTKNVKEGLHTAREMLSKINKFKMSAGGVEIEVEK